MSETNPWAGLASDSVSALPTNSVAVPVLLESPAVAWICWPQPTGTR